MNPSILLLAFVTGLTTGGLSCFAVQGGLLTSSIAAFAEQKKGQKPKIIEPILLFTFAKLVVHAILGFLLGLLGTVFSLSPVARGILQIGVAVFMIGNALRMLNVHPIFRIFAFEPPQSIRREIRRRSKQKNQWKTPVILGVLTVFIPCGVTQVMMASAVSAGSPWMGAGILIAFVLGASPAFLGVTYLAVRLSSLFEKQFNRVLAVGILLLGLFTLETGLNLTGSPISFSRALAVVRNDPPAAVSLQSTPIPPLVSQAVVQLPLVQDAETVDDELVDVRIDVLNEGYEPALIYAAAGKPVRLTLVTEGVFSCSRAFVIPSLNIQELLPESGEVVIEVPAQGAGSTLQFACSMGMFTGELHFQ